MPNDDTRNLRASPDSLSRFLLRLAAGGCVSSDFAIDAGRRHARGDRLRSLEYRA
ncbi:MAG: hypothetical protein K0Q64_1675, partial [Nitrobacter vulgaris]|nr:hypothetical protein [Nitrobacter vulgaris]